MTTTHIGIRIPDETLERLTVLAQLNNMTTNQLAKHAIMEWLQYNWLRRAELITIPKHNFAMLLEMLDPQKRDEFAKQIAKKVIEFYEFDAHRLAEFTQLDHFIESMVRFIGDKGFMWFDEMSFQTVKEPYYFTGRHQMGQMWSEMFFTIHQEILRQKDFHFQILPEKVVVNEKMVYIEFKKK